MEAGEKEEVAGALVVIERIDGILSLSYLIFIVSELSFIIFQLIPFKIEIG